MEPRDGDRGAGRVALDLRRRWRRADLPDATFDAAEALVWALDRTDDVLTWALALASALDRREGSTRTPLTPEHLGSRLDGIWTPKERAEVTRRLEPGADPDPPWGPFEAERPAPWVRIGDAIAPRRLYAWEQRVDAWVRAAANAPIAEPLPSVPSPADTDLTDEQHEAVERAASRRLTAITGGPGTGKTTVIRHVVRALLGRGIGPEAIALAAPTGKAAQRLRDALPSGGPTAQTLHRLLGYRPGIDELSAGRAQPLAAKVVIIDEASMVDLRLMERLLDALSPDARLVLVGDADQLPSVDAGAVFRDVVAAAPQCVVRLTRNLRVVTSEGGRALLELARDLRAGRARLPEPGDALPPPDVVGVFALRTEGDPRVDRRWWRRWIDGGTDAQKILTVTREGAAGSERINRETAGWRAARAGESGWAVGQPVMVTRNLHARGLFNGDIGVVAEGAGTARRGVVFATPRGEIRAALAALRDHLTAADALTVHKAQGSELDRVLLWLPPQPHPLLSRELLYTAVTRARRQVVIAGPPAVFAEAQRRALRRRTGAEAT